MRLLVVIAFGIVVGGLVVAFSHGSLAHTVRAVPSADKAAPPGATPNAGGGTAGPSQIGPSIFLAPPGLAGKIVHEYRTEYIYRQGGPDIANGRLLTEEIWLQFGINGSPTAYHLIARYQDGSFHQEILDNASSSTVVHEPAEAVTPPGGTPSCVERGQPDPKLLQAAVPAFANEASLPAFLYHRIGSGAPTKTRPAASTPPIAAPARSYPPDSSVDYWTKQTVLAGQPPILTRLEVGNQGRVELYENQQLDARGTVLSDFWQAPGELDVYNAANVPASAFQLTRE